ncbi:hypothetical protein P692DRAFT_201842245 [Suillus brevipes Sb2]|nr:hypothetical protein P692DRAFT_201842245 [Suillus brevipes Sb2]
MHTQTDFNISLSSIPPLEPPMPRVKADAINHQDDALGDAAGNDLDIDDLWQDFQVNHKDHDALRYERQEEHQEEVREERDRDEEPEHDDERDNEHDKEQEGIGNTGGDANNPEDEVRPQTMGWTDEDLEELHHMARLDDAQDATTFITALRKASLDDPHSCLPDDAIHRLRHPPRELPDTTNPDHIQSLKYYFADTTIKAYNAIPVAELSRVVPIVRDMCINTCLAFTGPFAHLDQDASTDRKKVARQRFDTFPVGPQLQALWHHPDQACKMHWREDQTKKIFEELKMTGGVPRIYEDIVHGKEYLDACQSGTIKDGDSVLMLLIDGAQLYESKQSDCWIYIWVIFDHAPEERYKKKYVLPGGIIPGLKKPKNLDSLSIQTEGLLIWDSVRAILFRSNPFLFIATLYCGLPGRHKPGAPTYYPALLQPDLHHQLRCDHPDVPMDHLPAAGSYNYQDNMEQLIHCQTMAQYEAVRLETGITKPSIFCGFNDQCILLVPHSVLMKETWKKHGSTIADATPFLPGSFDRPPRNPAEKINSRFKGWEWLLYLYGMGPAVLFGVLPDPYWTNLCHLVSGMCLMQQYHITCTDLVKAHEHLLTFLHDFETIYYQRRIDRLHFVRPWIHLTTHIPSETIAKGPPICSSQWTMERTIGNLAQEIHLHNSSINAIKAIVPSIEPEQNSLPKGSQDLGNGYVLLRRRERTPHPGHLCEAGAILRYLSSCGINVTAAPYVTQWACLRLPNGQVARSAWKENAMSRQPRIARNVKLSIDGEMSITEVLFYFNMTIHDKMKTFALVSQFSPPHAELLHRSFQTVVACHYRGDASLKLIEVSAIQSVVAMVPHHCSGIDDTLFYLIERPGLDIIQMGGIKD